MYSRLELMSSNDVGRASKLSPFIFFMGSAPEPVKRDQAAFLNVNLKKKIVLHLKEGGFFV